jgi:sulfide:quinone oxidoreductase
VEAVNERGRRHRVLILGGGVAGLEALIALHHLAAARVSMTLVAPSDEFVIRALSVGDAFDLPGSSAFDLEQVCRDHGASFLRDGVHSVHGARRLVLTRAGASLEYDSLLVTVGARARPPFPHVMTFRGPYDVGAMQAVLAEVERGATRRLAFIVPPGVTWPLPLYELALMTAERAAAGGAGVELTLLTPEPAPLALFGTTASEAVGGLLAERGIELHTGTFVEAIEGTRILASPDAPELTADRVVALPVLEGPRVAGLPRDEDGFLPADEHGRLHGLEDAYAAGDGTSVPIKQGGVAAQHADAAAASIAARAGAEVRPRPLRPDLRAQVLAGSTSMYLRHAAGDDAGDSDAVTAARAPGRPPSKVAAPYLAPYLARLSDGLTGPVPGSPAGLEEGAGGAGADPGARPSCG